MTALREIKDALAADPSYLDADEVPYDGETIAFLKDLLTAKVVTQVVEKEVHVRGPGAGRPSKDVHLSEEDQEQVIRGIRENLDELKEMGTGEGLETSEKIQIVKTKASLLDQLLKMQERYSNVAKMQQFIETVVGILNDFMNENDRDAILRRLEPYRA